MERTGPISEPATDRYLWSYPWEYGSVYMHEDYVTYTFNQIPCRAAGRSREELRDAFMEVHPGGSDVSREDKVILHYPRY